MKKIEKIKIEMALNGFEVEWCEEEKSEMASHFSNSMYNEKTMVFKSNEVDKLTKFVGELLTKAMSYNSEHNSHGKKEY
jgi:hypothetical protein